MVLKQKKTEVCSLDKDRGSCRNFTVKWFFDMEYGGCSRFWYGGCDGNDNRFASQEECKAHCVEPEPPCTKTFTILSITFNNNSLNPWLQWLVRCRRLLDLAKAIIRLGTMTQLPVLAASSAMAVAWATTIVSTLAKNANSSALHQNYSVSI